MELKSIYELTPIEFEKYCLEILKGYAEEEKLKDFSITHNRIVSVTDGDYQIDIYAEFTAMRSNFKVLCECKQYKGAVSREKVTTLHQKLQSIGAQKGILLSTGKFQSGAIKFAKEHGVALIHVEDYQFEYLSHSSGQPELDDDDPFLYAEKHMPPYVAFDCTSDTDEPQKIYPTREMMKKLLIEECQKIKEVLGIDVEPDFSQI